MWIYQILVPNAVTVFTFTDEETARECWKENRHIEGAKYWKIPVVTGHWDYMENGR